MLINIFGHWINPHYIKRVEDTASGDCFIHLADTLSCICIDDKTANEVAQEVNKHIALSKSEWSYTPHTQEELKRGYEAMKERREKNIENEWNDYDPKIEPQKEKWIEWSIQKEQGEPLKSKRNNKYYYFWLPLEQKISVSPYGWGYFDSSWGQWRYCPSPEGE